MSDAGELVKNRTNAAQQACFHYAHYRDPDDPESAMKQLLAHWNFDKKEEGPPVENVDERAPGDSAASSLSETLSPSRKKVKPSVPAETENESRGESSMTKNDEH